MELLALVAALQLAAHIQTPTAKEIVKDALGGCHIANCRKSHHTVHQQLHCTDEPTTKRLQTLQRHIRWTPAYPEKRKSMPANWPRDDCLNHVADRVAGGLADFDIDCQYNNMRLQAEDIMESLVLPNSWTLNMKDGSTPKRSRLQQ